MKAKIIGKLQQIFEQEETLEKNPEKLEYLIPKKVLEPEIKETIIFNPKSRLDTLETAQLLFPKISYLKLKKLTPKIYENFSIKMKKELDVRGRELSHLKVTYELNQQTLEELNNQKAL